MYGTDIKLIHITKRISSNGKLKRKNLLRSSLDALNTGSKKCQVKIPIIDRKTDTTTALISPSQLSSRANSISAKKRVVRNHKGPLPAKVPVHTRLVLRS